VTNSVRIRFCTYCRAISMFPGRVDDHITLSVCGDQRMAMVNAEPAIIQDGICPDCRLEKFPETVKRKDGTS
jgi:hypothetical protein